MPTKAPDTPRQSIVPTGKARALLAAWLESLGWLAIGLSAMLRGKGRAAVVDLRKSLKAAGLPDLWSEGFTITFTDPAFAAVAAETERLKREEWPVVGRDNDDTPDFGPKGGK